MVFLISVVFRCVWTYFGSTLQKCNHAFDWAYETPEHKRENVLESCLKTLHIIHYYSLLPQDDEEHRTRAAVCVCLYVCVRAHARVCLLWTVKSSEGQTVV